MLDVHPPHAPTHTWKDFLIHIATICVGLLIAVALEQTVEAIHRHHQREVLLESLQHESTQILRDTERTEVALSAQIRWHLQVDRQLTTAAHQHGPIGDVPSHPPSDFDIPDDPIYKAAKAGNKLELLTEEEAVAYGEMDAIIGHIDTAFELRENDSRIRRKSEREIDFTQSATPSPLQETFNSSTTGGVAPLYQLTIPMAALQQMHKDTVALEASSNNLRFWSRQGRGAATALLQGERDLHKIETAERQFDNLP